MRLQLWKYKFQERKTFIGIQTKNSFLNWWVYKWNVGNRLILLPTKFTRCTLKSQNKRYAISSVWNVLQFEIQKNRKKCSRLIEIKQYNSQYILNHLYKCRIGCFWNVTNEKDQVDGFYCKSTKFDGISLHFQSIAIGIHSCLHWEDRISMAML